MPRIRQSEPAPLDPRPAEIAASTPALTVVDGPKPDYAAPIHIVSNDDTLRAELCAMARNQGQSARGWSDPGHFLKAAPALAHALVVVDYDMSKLNAGKFLHQLRRLASPFASILLSRDKAVIEAAKAIADGASTMIGLPLDPDAFREIVLESRRQADRPARHAEAARCRTAIRALTRRERDILAGMVAGSANKTMAFELGLSQRTVEVHRANVMKKLGVTRFAEALRVAFLAEAAERASP